MDKYFTDKCTEAGSWLTFCNLCKDALDAAHKQCEVEKEQARQAGEAQCHEDVSSTSTDSFNSGVASGIADLKERAPRGEVFNLFGASVTCEALCNALLDRNGQRMTCVASISVASGGCLTDVSLQLGSCTDHDRDAQCICI